MLSLPLAHAQARCGGHGRRSRPTSTCPPTRRPSCWLLWRPRRRRQAAGASRALRSCAPRWAPCLHSPSAAPLPQAACRRSCQTQQGLPAGAGHKLRNAQGAGVGRSAVATESSRLERPASVALLWVQLAAASTRAAPTRHAWPAPNPLPQVVEELMSITDGQVVLKPGRDAGGVGALHAVPDTLGIGASWLAPYLWPSSLLSSLLRAALAPVPPDRAMGTSQSCGQLEAQHAPFLSARCSRLLRPAPLAAAHPAPPTPPHPPPSPPTPRARCPAPHPLSCCSDRRRHRRPAAVCVPHRLPRIPPRHGGAGAAGGGRGRAGMHVVGSCAGPGCRAQGLRGACMHPFA